MPYTINPFDKNCSPSFDVFFKPAREAIEGMPPLISKGNRPLQLTFEDQLKSLAFFHLKEHTSAQHLLQVLKEDDFARKHITPKGGIEKSSFSEATISRGLEQFAYVFSKLQSQAAGVLPIVYIF